MLVTMTKINVIDSNSCQIFKRQRLCTQHFSEASLLDQKQVICSCGVQKMICPAVAFILCGKRSCQDGNVGVDAENHMDVFFF